MPSLIARIRACPSALESQMNRLTVLAFALVTAICPAAPAFARSADPGDSTAVRQAAPAVVSISTWKLGESDQSGRPKRRVKAYGSGFIIDSAGIIVTNKHVVDGAFEISVVLNDGSLVPAKVLAVSSLIDLALLKISVGHPLPTLAWGDSDALLVGDPVLTIGNQLDWGTSVSAGIVSGLNRNLQDTPFDSYIQTDATINHGNSGGPLIDPNGKVVGIDTALYNPEENGGFIGIGFAIPSNSAAYVTRRLLDPSHPVPGWLGFNLQDMTGELAAAFSVPQAGGALISAVDASGPASKVGLRPGDILKQLNGKPLNDARAFMRGIAEVPIGSSVHLTIWRAGEEKEVTAPVAAWPNTMPQGGVISGKAAAAMMKMEPDPGMKLAAISEADRKQYGLSPDVTGVLITHVDPDSEAHELGIQPGNVIISMLGVPVTTPDEVRGAIKQAHEQGRPYLAGLLQTQTGVRWVSFSIAAS
jgi:serine protease Do